MAKLHRGPDSHLSDIVANTDPPDDLQMAIAKIAMRIEELAKQISEICGQQERPSETFFDMEIAHTQAVDLYFAASLMADLAQNIINYSYLLSLVPDGHPDSLSDEDAFHLLPSHPPWAF